jgi:hypothetical protein
MAVQTIEAHNSLVNLHADLGGRIKVNREVRKMVLTPYNPATLWVAYGTHGTERRLLHGWEFRRDSPSKGGTIGPAAFGAGLSLAKGSVWIALTPRIVAAPSHC